jgi:YHS domain-containing protein
MTPRTETLHRRSLLGAGVVLAFAALIPAATGVAAKQPAVYADIVKGVAVGGYDPVAYFTEKKPVKGSTEFTLEHDGATWRFASAANRDAFKVEPAKYAPQYGGYCAWAVASGYTAKGDPEAWTVTNGKLYLNYNKTVRKTWEQDIPGNVAKGDANWPKVLEK